MSGGVSTEAADLVGGDQLRAILDAIPSPVVFYDREHRYRYANPNYAAFCFSYGLQHR